MDVEFHPAALREAEKAQAWYEERSLLTGLAFLRELSAAIERICKSPARYPVALAGTRRILLDRFPFAVHYRFRSNTLTVIAVAHQKRWPGY